MTEQQQVPDTDGITPTDFQSALLKFRDHCYLLSAGGRGSGKTRGLILHIIDHMHRYGHEARPIVLREQWLSLQELQLELHELCTIAFGGVHRNKAEGTLTLPTGGVITFSNVSDENSYSRHQGRSYTGLFADEAGNYTVAGWRYTNKIRSNLRVPFGRRVDIHISANPHGRSHTLLFKEYISKAPPWHPFQDDQGDWWIWSTSDYTQNEHIDQEAYRRQLLASCGHDKALAEAWLKGTWSVLGGVMFDCFDPARHIIRRVPQGLNLKYVVGADHGTASPCTAILLGRVRDPVRPFRQGDIIALDETDTCLPGDLSTGTGASVFAWAEMVQEMLARNGCPKGTTVVTDDARGLNGDTVVQEMRNCQVNAIRPLKKDRVGTWALLRSLMQATLEGAERPAIFFTDRVPHLIETIPEAPRGTLRAEDIDPKFDRDHHIDGLGYGVRYVHQHRSGMGRTVGMW